MSSNRVDGCLLLDRPLRAAALLGMREDQWYERKSIRVSPRTFAEALVAFANAEGGAVVIGLSNGQVEDTAAAVKRMNELRQAPFNLTAPPVRTYFEEVEVESAEGSIATVLVARVSPGEAVHELSNGDVFLRVGDSSIRLGPAERQELLFDRGGAQYEARELPNVMISDLDEDQLGAYRDAIGASRDFPFERQLRARSLLTQSGGVSVGAYLLFSGNPTVLLPHAQVRILQYASVDRGTGANQSLMEGRDVRVEASIPSAIYRASTIIDDWIPQRRALQPDGRFGPIAMVPRDAWLEGLVNAVVHRSYSAAGDHIRVEIFPDRVEIESPGRFPGIVDPDNPLDIGRYARNPRIARVCSDLAITQELGEGIKRIFDEMRARGLSDPIYRQTAGSVRLTLSSVDRIDATLQATLPKGAEMILKLLRSTPGAWSTGQVVEAIGRSRPWVLKRLYALEDQGVVEWKGQSPNDPHATWQLGGR